MALRLCAVLFFLAAAAAPATFPPAAPAAPPASTAAPASAEAAGAGKPGNASLEPGIHVRKIEGTLFRLVGGGVGETADTGLTLETGQGIETGEDGQAVLEAPGWFEARVKEETRMIFLASATIEVSGGLMGIRFLAGCPAMVTIRTPHFEVRSGSGIGVAKVNEVLSRFAAVKGGFQFQGKTGPARFLEQGKEAASTPEETSADYTISDELRFAWYWTQPAR